MKLIPEWRVRTGYMKRHWACVDVEMNGWMHLREREKRMCVCMWLRVEDM